jgi:hypothetical protein
MDQALNVGFLVFHTTWVVFTCLGWIWRRTRTWQLALVLLTALSWFGLGARYGWGYCPCTDWHWQVRMRLGYDVPPSYTQLLVREATGIEMPATSANVLTLVALVAAGTAGVVLSLRDRRARPES